MSAFNIENYIHSLPDDIETIDVSFKSLTYLPSLKRFHKLTKLCCNNNQLTRLPELNNELQILHCHYNKLTILPELNYCLKILLCFNNQLTSLPKLNNELQTLYCSNNQLTSLPKLNHKLCELQCCYNKLTRLPKLNYSLQYLDCNHNKLICLPELNNNLQYLYCNNNLFTKIISIQPGMLTQDEKNKINNVFQCLHRFKLLFWSLKYKAQFRHWLWVRVRLPKIEMLYHPSKLNELLNASDMSEEELDSVLVNW